MQLDFFTAFKEVHHDVSIELTTFSCLKPWFVKCIKEWSTCCYRYHIKLMELKIGFNNMCSKTKGIHANCACNCVDVCCPIDVQDVTKCCASQITFLGSIKPRNSILCPNPSGDDQYKQSWLMGECSSCGINTLKVYPTKDVLFPSKMMHS